MNTYLDKGLFMICYVGSIHLFDSFTINQGSVSFGNIWAGAIVMVIIGLCFFAFQKD